MAAALALASCVETRKKKLARPYTQREVMQTCRKNRKIRISYVERRRLCAEHDKLNIRIFIYYDNRPRSTYEKETNFEFFDTRQRSEASIAFRLVRNESEADQKHHGNRSVAISDSVGEYHTGTDRKLAGKPSSTIR